MRINHFCFYHFLVQMVDEERPIFSEQPFNKRPMNQHPYFDCHDETCENLYDSVEMMTTARDCCRAFYTFSNETKNDNKAVSNESYFFLEKFSLDTKNHSKQRTLLRVVVSYCLNHAFTSCMTSSTTPSSNGLLRPADSTRFTND